MLASHPHVMRALSRMVPLRALQLVQNPARMLFILLTLCATAMRTVVTQTWTAIFMVVLHTNYHMDIAT